MADTSSDAGGDAALPPRPELSPARCNLILGIIVLSTTLYSMSILIVASVLPQLQGALSATPDEISWAMTFNILATAVATPLTSWLAGRLGRRNLLVVSLIIFTVATYFSGAATSLEMLIFWRIVQGAAGAPLSPMGQTVLLDIFPKHRHGVVIGIFGVGVVMGAFIGPMIGGIMAEKYTWRYAFYIIVPVGAVAAAGVLLALPRMRRARAQALRSSVSPASGSVGPISTSTSRPSASIAAPTISSRKPCRKRSQTATNSPRAPI